MVALRPNPSLAPHLREVCSLLATAMVRLRCRTAEQLAAEQTRVGTDGETSLHFTADQSGSADANRRRAA
jgi:hypothetical protein